MPIAILLAACLLAAAGPASAEDRAAPSLLLAGSAPASEAAAAPRPRVANGSKAPDFQYQSYDQLWQHLHNLLDHGDVLILFGASDVDLRTLERQREALVKQGVTPLAVVEKSERDVWASVRRLGLTFSLLADPRGAIGAQYGVFEPGLGRSRTAWFVIDRKGKVRQSGEAMPSQSWPTVAGVALGRQKSATKTASKR